MIACRRSSMLPQEGFVPRCLDDEHVARLGLGRQGLARVPLDSCTGLAWAVNPSRPTADVYPPPPASLRRVLLDPHVHVAAVWSAVFVMARSTSPGPAL